MIEDRHIELINAELDGELTTAERAELSRLLLANPEARALRVELSRLSGALEQLESVAPPSELATSVLSSLSMRRSSAPACEARRRPTWQTWSVRSAVRRPETGRRP